MKFAKYLRLISDDNGFFPTGHLRRIIRKNGRPTSREEAIAARVIEDANPRENITGRYPWDQEEQFFLQQLWINLATEATEWRDVPVYGASDLYTTQQVELPSGETVDLPVPNAVLEPGAVPLNLEDKIQEALGFSSG